MRARIAGSVVGMVCSLSASAAASPEGVELGIRSGYAIPMGNIGGEAKMNDLIAGAVPLWFDLGYRITPNVMVGAYFQYGFGFVPDSANCDVETGTAGVTGELDCSVHNMRLGLQAHYHFMPWETLDPWVGGGIGYEWLGYSSSGSVTIPGFGTESFDTSGTFRGFEFINLQGGLDLLPSDDTNFALGPFLSFSLAQYSTGSVEMPAGEASGDLDDKKLHQWLTLGVRGTFVP